MYTAKQFWSRHGPIIIDASLSQLQSLLQGDLTIGQNSAISSWESPSHGLAPGLGFFLRHGISSPLGTMVSTVDSQRHTQASLQRPLTPARLARCVPDEMKGDQPCRVVACS